MFVDIGNVKDATGLQQNHHKRQAAGVAIDSATKTKRSKPEPSYMYPLLKSEKSLQDLLDDYVVYSEW